jgi:hypothetical protein
MRAVLLAVVLLVATAPAAAAAPPTVIRTGGPSAPGDPKLAVVAGGRAGKRFAVVNASGRVVKRGRLKRAKGSAKPWRRAATADLGVLRPGRYRVRAAGRTSRPWVVSDAARSALVRRLLGLFAVNADGDEPNRVFGPAHRNDAIVRGGPLDGQRIDLTGGWRDAGDNLKITQPAAFAVAELELAAQLAPEDAPALHATADVGLRWLLKAHPQPGVFVGIVGDVRDHSTGFRDPAKDDADTHQGIGIRYAYTTTSSNILGSAAAALALAAQRSEGAQRDAYVAAARDWYEAAKQTNAITKLGDENVADFYPDNIFTDDLAFGALELHRATGDPALLAEALDHFRRGSDDDQLYAGTVPGTVGPLVAAELCGGLGAPKLDDLGCQALAKVAGAARERAAATPFATPGIVTFGSLQDNGGAGVMAAAAARTGVARDGLRIAAGARDYLLGRNAWGRSFVVGRGPIDAKHPHHPAFLKGSPARLLAGAVVNGPADPGSLRDSSLRLAKGPLRRFNSRAVVYEDRRADFVTSEVSLSVSASSLLLAASVVP